ncbi:hypothetical protein [uncultured Porphyromonas sp.]|uniref:hypothetical protein n=1 Tax=uncultured Porphyromonas sp. TaxID=159274 RepID=UPI0025962BAA|nr:hypothetical protein [uncultured Porphyromonas sp.]
MNRNKSDWYIGRMVTNGYGGVYTTKSTFEKRVDKKPEEVEVGDRVVMFGLDTREGVVKSIELYDDGLFKIAVGVNGVFTLFYTTPDRIGILEKGGSDEKE